MDIDKLLERARRDPHIAALSEAAARGAEAYFQAYGYIVDGGIYRTNRGRRRAAMEYLELAASPPLTEVQIAAADIARAIIKRFS